MDADSRAMQEAVLRLQTAERGRKARWHFQDQKDAATIMQVCAHTPANDLCITHALTAQTDTQAILRAQPGADQSCALRRPPRQRIYRGYHPPAGQETDGWGAARPVTPPEAIEHLEL